MIINCVYLLFIILLVILVVAILFEKTLKIEINLNHNHTNTNTSHEYKTESIASSVSQEYKELFDTVKTPPTSSEDEEFERQKIDAFTEVAGAMQLFQEVVEDERKRT